MESSISRTCKCSCHIQCTIIPSNENIKQKNDDKWEWVVIIANGDNEQCVIGHCGCVC